jgi:hypothetical protein
MVVARYRCESYVSDTMLYEFSLPTKSDKVPVGTDWIHEIKYDGYRMLVIRDRDRVRLVSRGGHDWADRFPLIVAGEVVVLDKAGVSDLTRCPRASTTSGRSSTRSTRWPAMIRISAGCRSPYARSAWRSCSRIRSTEFSSRNMSRAISATRYFASPAIWGSRALSRSTSIAPMALADAPTGLRSRTPHTSGLQQGQGCVYFAGSMEEVRSSSFTFLTLS